MSFNPFEAGRGLSTYYAVAFDDLTVFQSLWSRAGLSTAKRTPYLARVNVSIPLAQGGSFDLTVAGKIKNEKEFQSLWSRAGSFDLSYSIVIDEEDGLNPFGTGRGLST